ncbi:unnamed protein product [Amoebophrya sp. A25]|nr:unnamed protein product [Amoebophrya sp. A25]|eukprot:GSA25T00001844001.1
MVTTTSIHDAAAAGDIGKLQAMLDEDEELLNAVDSNKQTPLMLAAKNGEATVGSILAECGADLQIQDGDGNTALHHSCIANKRLVTSMLLWGGSERDVQNGEGDTPLHVACRVGAYDSAWLLVENGGEKSKRIENNAGKLPIDIAKEIEHKDLVEMLEKEDDYVEES